MKLKTSPNPVTITKVIKLDDGCFIPEPVMSHIDKHLFRVPYSIKKEFKKVLIEIFLHKTFQKKKRPIKISDELKFFFQVNLQRPDKLV